MLFDSNKTRNGSQNMLKETKMFLIICYRGSINDSIRSDLIQLSLGHAHTTKTTTNNQTPDVECGW